MKYERQRITPLLFTVYSAAASGRSPALPCFAAFLALVRFSGLFAFTQFFFQPRSGFADNLQDSVRSFSGPHLVVLLFIICISIIVAYGFEGNYSSYQGFLHID